MSKMIYAAWAVVVVAASAPAMAVLFGVSLAAALRGRDMDLGREWDA